MPVDAEIGSAPKISALGMAAKTPACLMDFRLVIGNKYTYLFCCRHAIIVNVYSCLLISVRWASTVFCFAFGVPV